MSKRFIRTYIELSDFCGLHCHFCPAPKGRRGEIGLELFERVCTQVTPLTESVTFHLLGDPLYLKALPQYLQIAQKYHLSVEIVTSGVYLHRYDKALLLSPPIKQISISLSALQDLSKEMGERVVRECLELIKTHQEGALQSYINLRMHEDKIDIPLTSYLCQTFGVSNELEQKGRVRLAYKVFLLLTKSFEWVRAEEGEGVNTEVRKRCYGLLSQVGILANGIVVPCCIDCDGGIALGNIKEQELQDILLSPRAKAIKEGFERGVAIEEQCKRCAYRAVE